MSETDKQFLMRMEALGPSPGADRERLLALATRGAKVVDGFLWARQVGEFMDGRFELLTAALKDTDNG